MSKFALAAAAVLTLTLAMPQVSFARSARGVSPRVFANVYGYAGPVRRVRPQQPAGSHWTYGNNLNRDFQLGGGY